MGFVVCFLAHSKIISLQDVLEMNLGRYRDLFYKCGLIYSLKCLSINQKNSMFHLCFLYVSLIRIKIRRRFPAHTPPTVISISCCRSMQWATCHYHHPRSPVLCQLHAAAINRWPLVLNATNSYDEGGITACCGDVYNSICALRHRGLGTAMELNVWRAIGSIWAGRHSTRSDGLCIISFVVSATTLSYYFVIQFHINNDEKCLIQLHSRASCRWLGYRTDPTSSGAGKR